MIKSKFSSWHAANFKKSKNSDDEIKYKPRNNKKLTLDNGRTVHKCGICSYFLSDVVKNKVPEGSILNRSSKQKGFQNKLSGECKKRTDEVSSFLPEYSGQLHNPTQSDVETAMNEHKKRQENNAYDVHMHIEGGIVCSSLIKDYQIKIQAIENAIDHLKKNKELEEYKGSLDNQLDTNIKGCNSRAKCISRDDDGMSGAPYRVKVQENLAEDLKNRKKEFNQSFEKALNSNKNSVKDLKKLAHQLKKEEELVKQQKEFEIQQQNEIEAEYGSHVGKKGAFGSVIVLNNTLMAGKGNNEPGDHNTLYKNIAVKKIDVTNANQQQFAKEVEAQKSTSSAKIHQAWTDDFDHILAMDAKKVTLADILEKHPDLGTAEFRRRLSRDVLKQLAELNKNGYIHCDVKPENIMFDFDTGKFFLVDYGIAKKITDPNTYAGTKDYQAPEVINKQEELVQSDIWSFATILVEWFLDGDMQEYHEIPKERHSAQVQYDFKDQVENNDELKFIEQMTCKDPKKRLSAKNLSNHPWLKKLTTHSDLEQVHRQQLHELAKLELEIKEARSSSSDYSNSKDKEERLKNLNSKITTTQEDLKNLRNSMRLFELTDDSRTLDNAIKRKEEMINQKNKGKISKKDKKEIDKLNYEIKQLENSKEDIELQIRNIKRSDNPHNKHLNFKN